MGTATVSSLFTAILGKKMLIVRPLLLATDWQWEIRERDNPSVVKDFSPSLILNATRHVFVNIDTDYEVNVAYELRVMDNVGAVELDGVFTVEQADFGTAPDFSLFNAKLRLALGLAGLDVRWEHRSHDRVSGIPLESHFEVFTDSTLTVVLARGVLKRRLNAVSMVVGEVMYLTFFDPDALLPSTGTGTGTGTGTT